MLSVKQVAEQLGVSVGLVYGLVATGKLGCYRVGNGRGVIRFTQEHVASYLAGTANNQEPRKAPPRLPRLKHLKL